MAELARVPIAAQIGVLATDPLGMIEPAGMFLVSGGGMPAPNSVRELPGGYGCWLAPDRFLAVTPTPPSGFVSDVTDGQAVFILTPGSAADFIAMGCTLNPDALAEGRCAQTLFAGLKVLLYRRDGLIHLHIDRPLAAWLLAWFRQAVTAL